MEEKRYLFKFLAILLTVTIFTTTLPVELLAEEESHSVSESLLESEQSISTEEPYILYEMEEKRGPNVKYFQMSDGSYLAAAYEYPIHFQSADGRYVEYDNTLEEEESANGKELHNKNSDQKVVLSKKAKQNKMVSVEVDDYEISWGFEKVNNSVAKIVQKEDGINLQNDAFLRMDKVVQEVEYEEVYPQVDLQYLLYPEVVKENIILKSKNAVQEFVQNYSIGKLQAEQMDSKTILLKDEDGRTVYTIYAPVMEDMDGNVSEDISLNIIETNGNHISVRISADREWLENENRQYPVTIDPLIQQEGNYNFKTDCYVTQSGSGTENRNSGALHTYVGVTSEGVNRTFLKVDIPSLGEGDVITKAYLSLVSIQNNVMGSGDYKIDAHEITSDWSISNVSFSHPYNTTVLDYALIPATDATIHSWDITRAVVNWQSSGMNYGIMLKGAVETGNVGRRFYTYKNTSEVLRPFLTVYYVNTVGLNDYNSYKTFDYGTYGTAYINEYRGSVTYTFQDVCYGGNLLNANVYHVYNSENYDQSGVYGKGWRLNLSENIRYVHGTNGLDDKYYYLYTDEDGTQIYFQETDIENTFEDEVGRGWQLKNSGSGDWTFTLEDKSGNQKGYDSNGYLKIVRDRNGNEMTLDYTGALVTSVTDSSGRITTLGYNEGVLAYIEDPAGRRSIFSYSSDGYLSRVERYNGEDIVFETLNERLSVVQMNTAKVVIGYSGKRFQSLAEGVVGQDSAVVKIQASYVHSGKTLFIYPGASGDIAASDRVLEHCLFNSWGQRITQYITDADGEMLGNIASVRYSANNLDNPGTNNKLKEGYVTGNAVNRILDGSFELGGQWNTSYWSEYEKPLAYFAVKEDIDEAYIGKNAACIMADTASESTVSFYEEISGLSEGTYTLSGYVRTEQIQGGKGVFLCGSVSYADESSNKEYFTQYLQGTTDPEVDQGWQRISISFDVPSVASSVRIHAGMSVGTSGKAWFDCLQLETGNQESDYNLVENAGFEQQGNWKPNVTTSMPDGISQDMAFQGEQSYKFCGEHTVNKQISQEITVYGGKEDVYILSGWAKAASVSLDDSTRNFYIECKIEYTDGTVRWPGIFKFDSTNTDWQYLSIPIRVENGDLMPKAITVFVGYFKNQNYCYFDNIQLVKDKTESYVYDENGNLTSAVTAAEENSQFVYADNEVVKQISPIGNKYYHTYSSGNEHLLIGSYADGVSYQFIHDEKGNVTETKAMSSELVDGGIYAFRSSFGNRVVDIYNSETTNGTQLINFKWNNTDNQKFIIRKVSGTEYYSIHPVIAPEKALTAWNGGTASATKIRLMDYNGEAYQQFQFVSNGNGEYRVVPRHAPEKAWDTWEAEDTSAAHIELWGNVQAESKGFILELLEKTEETLYTRATAVYTESGQYTASVTDSLGNTVNYSYNELKDELTSVTDAEGKRIGYENNCGDINTLVVYADANGDGVREEGERYVRYSSSKGQLDSIEGNQVSYHFGYDAYGNRTRVQVGNQVLANYVYNEATDTLAELQYGNGDKVSYHYDNLARLTEVQKESSGTVETTVYAYDKNGNVSRVTESGTGDHTIYSYDTLGRLVGAVSDQGFGRYQNYDDHNRIKQITYRRGDISQTYHYTYNDKNQIGNVELPTGKTLNSTYDGLNRLTTRTLDTITPVYERYTYFGNSDGSTSSWVSTLTTSQGIYSYTYDANGNIKSILKNGVLYESYTYDELNQLTVVMKDEDEYEYTYDINGNLQLVKKNGTVTDTYEYGDAGWKDKLTEYNGESISYDEIGNPLNYRDGIMFSWKNGRELASFHNEEYSVTYQQNGEGIRAEKQVIRCRTGEKESYHYDYNGNQLVCERRGSNTIWYLYDENEGAIGFTCNGIPYYYLKNLQGDITGIADQSGEVAAVYEYDVWGKVLAVRDGAGNDIGGVSSHIGNINPLRYRGYYYDAETGFYYVSSRYYDPEVGRFLNADSIIDNRGVITQNLFAYCGNNPVNNADPNGHLFGAVIGGIIGGILGGLTAAASGKSVKAGIISGAVTGAIIGGICDVASWGVAAATCAVVAAGGNAANQYANYKREKQKYSQKQSGSYGTSNKSKNTTTKSVPKKYQSFANYVDVDSVVTAGIAAAICAPIAVGGGAVVGGVFDDVTSSGIMTVSRFIAEGAIGANVSMLQTSTEYIIPLFEPSP